MSGGPVNGVSWSAMLGSVGGGVISQAIRGDDADPNDPVNYTGIIVPTVLQMAADAVSYWTSLTCLYDRYWTAEPDRVTLPICMFHIKKITSTFSNEVSKKRVILYEPENDEKISTADLADNMRPPVMQTIVDNAVKNPRTYTMEVIVPFQPIGRYVTEGVKTITDMITGIGDLVGGEGGAGLTNVWEGIFSSVFALLKTGSQLTGLVGKLPGMAGVSCINMNSLEAMAESCRTLCMKMWTGYDYKYVMITGLSYDKEPDEDDVFRATLTLQEIPVLSITRPKSRKPAVIKRNLAVAAVTAVQGALVLPLIAFTDVKSAAGSKETWTGMIESALGK
jgi:hypothetical protein